MNLLRTPGTRRLLFALLYLCEGAPIGFIWGTLPVLLAKRGDADADVTALLALVVLPWTLKVLFAPLVDVLQRPRFTLRAWIVTAQLAMVATLVPLVGASLPALPVLTTLLVLHAVAAAIQDVSIDNLAIRTTTPAERGKATAAMQAGLLTGRVAFGALALWASTSLGPRVVVLALIALLLAGTLLAFTYPAPPPPTARAPLRSFLTTLGRTARSRTTWLALAFAAVGGTAYEAAAGVARTYLAGRGLAADTIAVQFALPTLALMALGAWIGGALADRRGRMQAVVAASLYVSSAVAAVAWAATLPATTPALIALLALYLGVGMFTASTYALFMDLTDETIAATQFSAFMGATNLCESWSIALCGTWASTLGYPSTFARFAGLGLLALVPLWLLRRHAPPRPAN